VKSDKNYKTNQCQNIGQCLDYESRLLWARSITMEQIYLGKKVWFC